MKNRITRISPERKAELKELIEQIRQESYDQGYEDGKAFVSIETVEDNTITHEGKLLRKVNREAREGDYVRPSNQKYARLIDGEIYGPVFKGSGQLLVDGYSVYAKGHNRTTSTVEVFELVEAIPQIVKSANQQRAELIQSAKEFIDNSIQNYFDFGITTFEFVVNAEKRTVVALERGNRTKTVYKKGIAKCIPGEVFHAGIGKAIALAKALKIDIPVEFLEAIQPDEVVVGHKVRGNYAEENYEVPAFHSHEHLDGMYGRAIAIHGIEKSAWVGTKQVTIIDDTNAQYEITP
ncbi:MAG: hypothetical protein ABS938_11565 [Psychrobacillus psychrodurans]